MKHEITTVFANLVTAELLDSWLANPSQVPARTTSSPWPDRIEVRDITKNADRNYEVTGDVIWVTSAEVVKGEAARREEIELIVVRSPNGVWRINFLGYVAQPLKHQCDTRQPMRTNLSPRRRAQESLCRQEVDARKGIRE